MEIASGKIIGADQRGLTIFVPYTDTHRYITRQYDEVQVGLADGRTITPQQRRKAYALLGEIVAWSGGELEQIKDVTKHDFVRDHLQGLQKELFSLSNCDVTTAKEYITYLVGFIVEWGVPTHVPLVEYCEDVQKYVYQCLMHKRCAVCGKPCDLHHWTRLGMGVNRKMVVHEGMSVEPLCREHHQECHRMAQNDFDLLHHIEPVTATKEICRKYGLKYEAE